MHTKLNKIRDCLICCVEKEMGHLDAVNAKELGEVIDMIKDIEETKYFHSITKAMEDPTYGEPSTNKHKIIMKHHMSAKEDTNDMMMEHDEKEGKSWLHRKTYMEAKEMHHDTPMKIKELEEYLKELSEDVVEMIEGASAEERAVLQQKLVLLANKVKNV